MKTYVITFEGGVFAVVQAEPSIDIEGIVNDWVKKREKTQAPLKNLLYILRQSGAVLLDLH